MNERLTRVGPNTPCGNLMRRYWIPIAPYAQIVDDPVRRVRVLGEDLVLYRNRSGILGLIGATNLSGYPVQELGGLVFAYLGPLPAPALPRWDLYVWPNAIRQIAVNVLNCNWLQCQENTADPTHSVWTHGKFFQYVLERNGDRERAESSVHTMHNRMKLGVGIKEIFAEPIPYGMKKGVVYSKELGAPADGARESNWVIFPFCTRVGSKGSPRSEFQLRVPIDDTHTYHICYQVYAAPPEVPAPHQDVVPWYEPPTADEHGRPILDYVLAQDMMVWTAQGPIFDRTAEVLGRTDAAIVFLRRQLDEQIRLVEEGKDPINVFKESPSSIPTAAEQSAPQNASQEIREQSLRFRGMYHRGYGQDDADRYGPVFELVKDLHRRIEEYATAQARVLA